MTQVDILILEIISLIVGIKEAMVGLMLLKQ
jgi:hypothetical protein